MKAEEQGDKFCFLLNFIKDMKHVFSTFYLSFLIIWGYQRPIYSREMAVPYFDFMLHIFSPLIYSQKHSLYLPILLL